MSDIRFNRWLHQSGTGGVYQASSGNVGIGTSVPSTTLDVNGSISATSISAPSITATTGTITGNLSVGGVLTYEDVTNIDSVGVVTARAGVKIPDSQKIFLGTADDLQIYHDGSESYVAEEGEGGLTISSGLISFKNQSRSETHATMTVNSGVSLFHNNLEKFKTTSGGIRVLGDTTLEGHLDMRDSDRIRLGAGDDLSIFHNGTHNFIDSAGSADLYVRGANILLQDHVNSNRNWLIGLANGTLEMYHAGSKKLETTSTGVKIDNSSTTDMILLDVSGTNFARIGHNSASGTEVLDVRSEGHTRFLTGGNNERIRITSAGDMGLGTATPTSFGPTFQVAGTDPALLLQDTATAVDYFGVNVASGVVNTWFDDAAALTINTASGISGSGLSENLRIKSGGEITNGNLSINGFANQNTPSGYSQYQSDNHANTLFGQNLKLGTSGGSGNHQIEIINQHATIGGAGMYMGGNGSNQQNAINFYAEAANQSAGTDVTANRRAQINSSAYFTWVEPRNQSSNAQSYLRTFGFTFNLQDGETETLFYNPDGYRRIYYELFVQSAHGSNGYGYILANISRYGMQVHESDWHVSYTSYAHSSSVNGNVQHNGIKFTRSGYSNTNITYYVIVKCWSPAGGSPYSNSGLTDPSYRYFTSGY